MFVGSMSLDLLLGDVHSLKEKRSLVRPIVAELRRAFDVSAAETGHLDLHRRAEVGVAVVAPDAGHCREVLDACERLVAGRPRSSCWRRASGLGRRDDDCSQAPERTDQDHCDPRPTHRTDDRPLRHR